MVSNDERLLMSLSLDSVAWDFIIPSKISELEHQLSTIATSKLTAAIKEQLVSLPPDFDEQVKKDKGLSEGVKS